VDPRSSRELFWLLLLGAVLVLGGVLYAWPHLQLREAGKETQELSRDKERLLEENRKLRLEKASLENLRRVETIASRELGMKAPAPENTIVIELPEEPLPAPRVASVPAAPGERRRN
jgi:cell division protein FtsL